MKFSALLLALAASTTSGCGATRSEEGSAGGTTPRPAPTPKPAESRGAPGDASPTDGAPSNSASPSSSSPSSSSPSSSPPSNGSPTNTTSTGPADPALERRYAFAEKLRRPTAGCDAPLALVTFTTPSLDERRRVVAQVLRLYPEFRVVDTPAAPFEVSLFEAEFVRGGPYEPENSSPPRHPLLVRCADGLTCNRLGAVLATATQQKYGLGCDRVEGLDVRGRWPIATAATSSLTSAESCARTRLCATMELGRRWDCETHHDKDLQRCAAESTCSAVVACQSKLEGKTTRPGQPRPQPTFTPDL